MSKMAAPDSNRDHAKNLQMLCGSLPHDSSVPQLLGKFLGAIES